MTCSINYEMTQSDLQIRQAVLHLYAKLGETEEAINQIEHKVQDFTKSHFSLESILPQSSLPDYSLNKLRFHERQQIIESNKLKITLHLIPPNFEIKAHLHSQIINIIYVLRGELKVEQYSLSDCSQKSVFKKKKKGEACAGLRHLKNIHCIKTTDSPCIFLSIRVKDKTHFHPNLKKLISYFFTSFILVNPFVYAEELIDSNSSNPLSFSNIKSTNSNVELANKLREGVGVPQDLYEAVQLYMREANRGNAEAQYWLGVMYLEGSGITEYYDEALDWVAKASDQDYPPAQKLLKHMLETEEVLDC